MPREFLTAKQEAFCQQYAKTRNGAGSYKFAYDCSPDIDSTSMAQQAAHLLNDVKITSRIKAIIDRLETPWGIQEILEFWHTMATADPDELMGMRTGNCRYCRGADHLYQWREGEFMEECDRVSRLNIQYKTTPDLMQPFPDIAGGFGFNHTLPPFEDCPRCGGEGIQRVVARDTSKLSPGARLLYGGVKQTKNGLEMVIADRSKAVENLARMLGGYKDGVRLDGSIEMAGRIVALQTTDPNEAARAYEDMIRGKLAT